MSKSRARWTQQEYVDYIMHGKKPASKPLTPSESTAKPRQARTPNKTEAAYARAYLAGQDARYEALTFRLACGAKYTPDFVVFVDGRPTECHECKGGYRLPSHGRSRLAFLQAKVEFPGLKWVFAVKSKDGWRVEE